MKTKKDKTIHVPTRAHEADEVGVVMLSDKFKKKLKYIVIK